MPIVTWDSSLVIDIQCFDKDHEHLVFLINKTYDMMLAKKSDKELDEILNELIAYTVYHFSAEESWMHEHKYPKLVEHKAQHDLFNREVLKFHQEFIAGEQFITEAIFTFLKQWLTEHIQKVDTEYARFARAHNINC